MRALIVASACAALLAALPGCTYYVRADGTPVPAGYPNRRAPSTAPSPPRPARCATRASRSRVEDRASGTVVGGSGDGTVTATLRQQADGSVRVQFDSSDMRDPQADRPRLAQLRPTNGEMTAALREVNRCARPGCTKALAYFAVLLALAT